MNITFITTGNHKTPVTEKEIQGIKRSLYKHFHITLLGTKIPKYISEYQDDAVSLNIADYLQYNMSQQKKRAITKLRLRSNRLEVIRGRFTRPKTPLEDRICKTCKSGIDDEMHFITQCATLTELRIRLYKNIRAINHDFPNLSDEDKTKYILNPPSEEAAEFIGTFLIQSIDKRNI